MGNLTKDEIEKLPNRFDTISFRTFFKLWYALQKGLPKEQKGEIFNFKISQNTLEGVVRSNYI